MPLAKVYQEEENYEFKDVKAAINSLNTSKGGNKITNMKIRTSISVQVNTLGPQSFVVSTGGVDQHSWLPTIHQMPVAACPHQLLQTKMSAGVMFTREQNHSSLRNPAQGQHFTILHAERN